MCINTDELILMVWQQQELHDCSKPMQNEQTSDYSAVNFDLMAVQKYLYTADQAEPRHERKEQAEEQVVSLHGPGLSKLLCCSAVDSCADTTSSPMNPLSKIKSNSSGLEAVPHRRKAPFWSVDPGPWQVL